MSSTIPATYVRCTRTSPRTGASTPSAAGEALNLRYGFPFYRISYTYDVAPDPALRVALGGSLQIRDATITFSAADGSTRRARPGPDSEDPETRIRD